MASLSVVVSSFVAGEWGPQLASRADLPKYQAAARLLENFFVTQQGALERRPGTRFIGKLDVDWEGNLETYFRLFPFQYGTTTSYMLVFYAWRTATGQDSYILVLKHGEFLEDTGSPVSLAGWTAAPSFMAYYMDFGPIGTKRTFDVLYAGTTKLTFAGDAFSYPGYGLNIRNGDYKWTASGGAYYLEKALGGDPGIARPCVIREDPFTKNGKLLVWDTALSSAGTWKWAKDPTSTYDTVWVKPFAGVDPDSKPSRYMEACYPRPLPLHSWAWGFIPTGDRVGVWVNTGGTPTSVVGYPWLKLRPGYPSTPLPWTNTTTHESKDFTRIQAVQDGKKIWFFCKGYNPWRLSRTVLAETTTGGWELKDAVVETCLYPSPAPPASVTVNSSTVYVRNADWVWKRASGALSIYYLTTASGGDPKLSETGTNDFKHDAHPGGTIGTCPKKTSYSGLAATFDWWWGDHDSLGFNTIYVYDGITGGPEARPVDFYAAENQAGIDYCVTSVAADGEEGTFYYQSVASSNRVSNIFQAGPTARITILAPNSKIPYQKVPAYYNIYRKWNENWAWVGSVKKGATTTPFTIPNITPDATKGPPIPLFDTITLSLTSPTQKLAAGTFFQQRLVVGGEEGLPKFVSGSVTGYHTNFSAQAPLKDDDAFQFELSSQDFQEIRWLVGGKELLIGTSAGIWALSAASGPLTSLNVQARLQTNWGSELIQPATAGGNVLFVQKGGRILRSIGYSFESDSYRAADLTVYVPHFFSEDQIKRVVFHGGKIPIVWVLTTSGKLYGATYSQEHNVVAWFRYTSPNAKIHDIGDLYGPGDDDASLYMVVEREVGANRRITVEMLYDQSAVTVKTLQDGRFGDCFFVGEFSSPVTEIYGAQHLDGETLAVVADGEVVEGKKIENGMIILDKPASKVFVGVQYTSKLETMDLMVTGTGGTTQDKMAGIHSAVLFLDAAIPGLKIGPDFVPGNMTDVTFPEYSGDFFSGHLETSLNFRETRYPRLCIAFSKPAPCKILSLVAREEIGAF